MLFSASVPLLSACFLSAPSSFEAVTDAIRGGCPPGPSAQLGAASTLPPSTSGASAPLPSVQFQPLLCPVRV